MRASHTNLSKVANFRKAIFAASSWGIVPALRSAPCPQAHTPEGWRDPRDRAMPYRIMTKWDMPEDVPPNLRLGQAAWWGPCSLGWG